MTLCDTLLYAPASSPGLSSVCQEHIGSRVPATGYVARHIPRTGHNFSPPGFGTGTCPSASTCRTMRCVVKQHTFPDVQCTSQVCPVHTYLGRPDVVRAASLWGWQGGGDMHAHKVRTSFTFRWPRDMQCGPAVLELLERSSAAGQDGVACVA